MRMTLEQYITTSTYGKYQYDPRFFFFININKPTFEYLLTLTMSISVLNISIFKLNTFSFARHKYDDLQMWRAFHITSSSSTYDFRQLVDTWSQER